LVGEHGGGAFVLVYLLCLALVGLPLMVAEVAIGRRTQRNPIGALGELARLGGRSGTWRLVAALGLVASFIVLSYYGVIAGWVLAYTVRSALGTFERVTADGIRYIFADLLADPERLLAWHSVFMGLTAVVVVRGVRRGLEQAVLILVPTMLLLLSVLVGYAATSDAFAAAVASFLRPDFRALTGGAVLAALGHAFFTLSLGTGAMLVYGSYLHRQVPVVRCSLNVVLIDTLIALMAGLVIYTIIADRNLVPVGGPTLLFETLPLAFGQLPLGRTFLTLFCILLAFAAWTSAISLAEPIVSWLRERWGIGRLGAGVVVVGGAWLLGIVSLLAFNAWAGIEVLGRSWFEMLDHLAADILLPVSGLLIAVFTVWVLSRELTRMEFGLGRRSFALWWFILRYVTTGLMVIILLHASGLLVHLRIALLGH
jgi:NSS family neurotransmitter:Na+ symporter